MPSIPDLTTLPLSSRALVYATRMHAGQYRRYGGREYIWHPVEVAAELRSLGASETALVVALLHDVIEDTEATRDEVEELFGAEIAECVQELTSPDFVDKADRLPYFARRIPEYSRTALQVKLADRLMNLRDSALAPEDSRARWRRETETMLAAIPEDKSKDPVVEGLVARLGPFVAPVAGGGAS